MVRRLTGARSHVGTAVRWAATVVAIAGGIVIQIGCGKKGPPLAPIVRIPAAITRVETRRIGDDVYVTVAIPSTNMDETVPADVTRVEVYGHTALTTPPRARMLEGATIVGVIPVAPPLAAPGAAPPPAAPAPPGRSTGALQGEVVTVRDSLTADDFEPYTLPPPPGRGRPAPQPAAIAPPNSELRRFYVAVAFSARGRPGPPSAPVELPLTLIPEAPRGLRVEHTATTIRLEWDPSGGLLGFLLDKALAPEAPPSDRFSETALRGAALLPGDLPAGATRYNVYREIAPDPLVLRPRAVPVAAWAAVGPAPANGSPIESTTFTEPIGFDGRPVCYVVRAVRGTAASAVEGSPSERACVTAFDTFPPEAPRGLSAVATAGAIDLVWEANTEADLGGYVILRGGAGDATLTPLVDRPISDTRYSDRAIEPGRRYFYAVVAADSRLPLPNLSAESARVEETAR